MKTLLILVLALASLASVSSQAQIMTIACDGNGAQPEDLVNALESKETDTVKIFAEIEFTSKIGRKARVMSISSAELSIDGENMESVKATQTEDGIELAGRGFNGVTFTEMDCSKEDGAESYALADHQENRNPRGIAGPRHTKYDCKCKTTEGGGDLL
jgi:hypothetical protein